ncbi:hypothetical protein O0I10_001487 [Lichtheimia ornata]|uniref:F-box domain-containing protein n=1 Tax=Lichtheimia ornata TaxID=688661 RepID=A0AAD7Y255_9FUNG|nr:uncharacterized protein O0I10_001487 [Lichtheimia ornata]KAJ8662526.1 hypothetical protein O0I10_001487 [Lichtheimia ornata]
MDVLPYDVANSIFSHLSQSDCLQCMDASPWWVAMTPQYATRVWRDIEITNHTNLHQKHMLQCLGSHVKKVSFRELSNHRLIQAMRMLINQQCTGLQQLEFIGCSIMDVYTFLRLLGQLACYSTVTTLFLHEAYQSNVDVIQLIEACPHLQRLSYMTNFHGNNNNKSSFGIPMDQAERVSSSKVTHLHLHGGILQQAGDDISRILHHCPSLESLCLCCDMRGCDRRRQPFDLETIQQMCPKLTSLECNIDCGGGGFLSSWQEYDNSKESSVGLRRFVALEQKGYGSDQMAPTLMQHGHTLQVLSLSRDDRLCGLQTEWRNLDAWMNGSALRVLSLDNINIKGHTVAALLKQTRQVEEFLWVTPRADRMTNDVADALCELDQLRCLHIGYCPGNGGGISCDDGRSIAGVDGFERLFECLGTNNKVNNSRLQVLGLMGRGLVTDRMLERIATISTLKKLGLWYAAAGDEDDLSDDGMMHFATHLQTTRLEYLQLADMSALSDKVLGQLVQKQQHLKHVDLTGCNLVTNAGLLQLLNNVRSISVNNCALITRCAIAEFQTQLGKHMVQFSPSD